MEEVSSAVAPRSAVIIIDQNKLRRASVVNFLRSWADSISATLVGMRFVETAQDLNLGCECRLAVLNLGASYIDSPDAQCLLEILREQLPDTPVVLFSDLEEPREVIAAFRAGAKGFIPASIEPDVVIQALTFIMGGGTFFPPEVLLELRGQRSPGGAEDEAADHGGPTMHEPNAVGGDPQGGRSGQLTLRQLDVFALLRQGKSNKMIARELGMREATVKVHVRQIMRKLGASNRTQAALCGIDTLSDSLQHESLIDEGLPLAIEANPAESKQASRLSKEIVTGHRVLAGGFLGVALVESAMFDMATALSAFLV